MKKLMMFASVVATACAVQAGSFVWGFGGGADDPEGATGWMDSGATALLYLGSVSFDSSTGWNTSGATFITSAGYDTATDSGFGQMDTGSRPSNAAIDAAGGQAYTLILVDSAGVTDLAGYTGDGKNYYISTGTSSSVTIPDMGSGEEVYAMLVNTTFVTASMWQSAATSGGGGDVPEPTSGILLLVGGAMLALRRRRA